MDLNERKLWNERHKQLTNQILKPLQHADTVQLFLRQHALLHSSQLGDSPSATLEDELVQGLTEEAFRKYPVTAPDTKNSIAWHLWHIARIEDMTMNVLVNNGEQLFLSGDWSRQLNIPYLHTGNEITEEEGAELSAKMEFPALLSYRREVGRRTREIVAGLQPGDFKRKVEAERIRKLEEQGAVKKEAMWLLEYWQNKTVAGLILMPATRHNFLHLNKSIRIKEKLQKHICL